LMTLRLPLGPACPHPTSKRLWCRLVLHGIETPHVQLATTRQDDGPKMTPLAPGRNCCALTGTTARQVAPCLASFRSSLFTRHE
jgi:hypothetical protein